MERSDADKQDTGTLEIRESVQSDEAAIERLYPEAFPDEDLLPLVRGLLADTDVALSLVARMNAEIVGHVVFTRCEVSGDSANVSLLGPLGVAPAWQRRGIGSELVRTGLRRQEGEGVQIVLVLGDPAYYGRLGFTVENSVEPPFPLPSEWKGAWQSQNLSEGKSRSHDKLLVPPQWQKRELWTD